MPDKNTASAKFHKALKERLKTLLGKFTLPPPVFQTMQGEFVNFDLEKKILECKFPVMEEFLNPYGSLQGGIISAAIDNTIGPLSMVVAEPNFTRRMDLKFSKPVPAEAKHIRVIARFTAQKRQMLFFEAEVLNESGECCATAKATHWIVNM